MAETTNTLFRFATARAPELVSQEVKQKYFVHHPAPATEGHFKALVATPVADVTDRIQAWTALASTFTALPNTEEVKVFTGNTFYEFATELAKNSSTPANGINPLAHAQIITLWDNLFYQLIINDNVAVKELVGQLLVANHYLQVSAQYGTDEKAAASRIVVPQAFYTAAVAEDAEPNTLPRVYTRELEKYIDAEIAQQNVLALEKTITELKTIQEKQISKTLNTNLQ